MMMEDAMADPHLDSAEETARAWLRRLIAGLLNVDEQDIAIDQPLGELGIDSLTAAEFSVQIEEDTGVNLPLEGFLGRRTLTDVARELAGGGFVTDFNVATL
jgi:acyl carrier protein